MAAKDRKQDTIFSCVYLIFLALFAVLAIYFSILAHNTVDEKKYAELGYFFKLIGVTHGFFTPLTYLSIKAFREGHFEPVNLLAWLLFAVLWFYAV